MKYYQQFFESSFSFLCLNDVISLMVLQAERVVSLQQSLLRERLDSIARERVDSTRKSRRQEPL